MRCRTSVWLAVSMAFLSSAALLANELVEPDARVARRLAYILNGNADLAPLGFRVGQSHATVEAQIASLKENSSSALRQELILRKAGQDLQTPQRALQYIFTLNTPYQGTFILSFCDTSPVIASPTSRLRLHAIRYGYRTRSTVVEAALARIGSSETQIKKDRRFSLRSQDGSTTLAFEPQTGPGPIEQVAVASLRLARTPNPDGSELADGSITEHYASRHPSCSAALSDLPREQFEVIESRLR